MGLNISLTNFPNGITSFGIPVLGTGALPPFTGNYWFVQETQAPGVIAGEGQVGSPFNTLGQALSAATNNNNDVIFITGTVHLTAPLVWNKSLTHLVGLCNGIKQGKRARISPLGGTAAFGPLVQVTGSGCLFSNFGTFFGFPVTGSTTPICWQDTGGRNNYAGVEFLGFGDATVTTGTANQTGARAFQFNNNTGESTFSDCVFGADTLQRGAANYTLEIAGNAPRLTFERCRFVADLAAGGTGGSHVLVGAAGIDRACYFEDCDFMVDTLSGSSTMAQIMNLSGSAGGVVMLTGRTNFFGGTHWETSQSGTLYGTVPLPVAADMGKALEVAT
jgi:hypothetical protein